MSEKSDRPQGNVPETPRDAMHPRRAHRASRGMQKGPQDHAEGEHGDKWRERFVEQLHARGPRPSSEEVAREHQHDAAYEGKRRLVEDRQQHDEAEKNSERKRLFIEHERGNDRDVPSDNRGSLHGVLGHREHRADYRIREEHGLRAEDES